MNQKTPCCNHHNHHATDSVNGFMLNTKKHNEAIVASFRFCLTKSIPEAENLIFDFMKELAAKIKENNGVIGHIKAYAETVDGGFFISLTDDEPNISHSSSHLTIEGVAIILGVEEVFLKDLLQQMIEEMLL